jgi:hypothetical protein
MAIAAVGGVTFEPKNPLTTLMADRKTGQMNPEVLGEKVLSAIIEIMVPVERIPEIIAAVRQVSRQISTVCSLDLTTKVDPDGGLKAFALAQAAGVKPTINGKTNLGLGRPFFVEEARA